MIYQIIHNIFLIYTLLLLVRIIGSWFANLYRYKWMHFVMALTDPYLNLFRRIIPPIGGTLDISPILAFISLRLLEGLVFYVLSP